MPSLSFSLALFRLLSTHTLEARVAHAQHFMTHAGFKHPVFVDLPTDSNLNNSTTDNQTDPNAKHQHNITSFNALFAAWPLRFYILDPIHASIPTNARSTPSLATHLATNPLKHLDGCGYDGVRVSFIAQSAKGYVQASELDRSAYTHTPFPLSGIMLCVYCIYGGVLVLNEMNECISRRNDFSPRPTSTRLPFAITWVGIGRGIFE